MTFTSSLHILAAAALAIVLHGGSATAQPAEQQLERLAELYAEHAHAIRGFNDAAPLLDAMADRRFVLLGESTHGTREYYTWRDRISRHLIEEHGFRFVGVEGDWENIQRVNEYVKHRAPEGTTARDALTEHSRWPEWMWENEEFEAFVEWLYEFNADRPEEERAGLHGLDLQDPRDSMRAVIAWFEAHDEENASAIREAYQCLKQYEGGLGDYARQLFEGGSDCTEEVLRPVEILRARFEEDPDDAVLWATKQNALAVKRAELQHRSMLLGGPNSWNQRASHMHEAFLRIAERRGPESRGIVWAHNTHVGDASMSEMSNRGEINIGQLLRESAGRENVFILGFGSHRGTVVAGNNWDEPRQVMQMLESRPDSHEGVLHATGIGDLLLLFEDTPLREQENILPLAQRAIGVVYRPPGEAYVGTILPYRYDGFLFFEETSALTPYEM